MLTVVLSSGATTCTARRGVLRRGGLPHGSGTFLRGGFFGHTHTLVEDGMGPPPSSRTSRQRQPGGEAPARAGAQQARSPEHGQLERGGVTTPQPREGSSISRSSQQPTTSQSRPSAPHRIPDSPKQQQPLRRVRNDEVARAAQDEMVVLFPGSGSGAARRLRNTPAAAAPTTLPFGPLLEELQQQQPPVAVIPEGGGAEPPPPSMATSSVVFCGSVPRICTE